MASETILPQFIPDRKLLRALLLLLSLKGVVKGMVASAILVLILTVFTALASALCECTSNISSLWQHSDSITRLFLLCLAIYCIRKAFPYALALHGRGIL